MHGAFSSFLSRQVLEATPVRPVNKTGLCTPGRQYYLWRKHQLQLSAAMPSAVSVFLLRAGSEHLHHEDRSEASIPICEDPSRPAGYFWGREGHLQDGRLTRLDSSEELGAASQVVAKAASQRGAFGPRHVAIIGHGQFDHPEVPRSHSGHAAKRHEAFGLSLVVAHLTSGRHVLVQHVSSRKLETLRCVLLSLRSLGYRI
mmetsp:Transcript_78903/g.231592  ORF Transcript_78903/g.231592 Transcript_78903/m.231592 type:complete len:201 (+) Transcript_78903:142-744(+)